MVLHMLGVAQVQATLRVAAAAAGRQAFDDSIYAQRDVVSQGNQQLLASSSAATGANQPAIRPRHGRGPSAGPSKAPRIPRDMRNRAEVEQLVAEILLLFNRGGSVPPPHDVEQQRARNPCSKTARVDEAVPPAPLASVRNSAYLSCNIPVPEEDGDARADAAFCRPTTAGDGHAASGHEPGPSCSGADDADCAWAEFLRILRRGEFYRLARPLWTKGSTSVVLIGGKWHGSTVHVDWAEAKNVAFPLFGGNETFVSLQFALLGL